MRSEQEMLDLILVTARKDERIRAVIMNGSRANPDAPRDIFQDYDIVYFVTDVESFKQDPAWINRFGELMIMQLPEDMQDPPPSKDEGYAYLMQFADGNRIDLGIFPLTKAKIKAQDSLTLLLLDKDALVGLVSPASENDYLPKPPSAKTFSDCCNEFWWMCPYVAKGLWRGEITYAKSMMDVAVREELMKMLVWHIGVKTGFSVNPGKMGKYFQKYLEPELWDALQRTYADASDENSWDALFMMCNLFRITAMHVAGHFGFSYPYSDDNNVSVHLQHVRMLPRDSMQIY